MLLLERMSLLLGRVIAVSISKDAVTVSAVRAGLGIGFIYWI